MKRKWTQTPAGFVVALLTIAGLIGLMVVVILGVIAWWLDLDQSM